MEYTHELILPNSDLPFKMFLFEGERENFLRDRHWHRSIEIFAVFEGKVRFDLGGKEYCLESGDFMLVNSNEVHSIQALTNNKAIVLQLPLSTFERYYTENNFIYFTHSKKVYDKELMDLIAQMYQIYLEQGIGYELNVQSIFYRIIYLLICKYRENSVDPEQLRIYNKMNRLNSITGYIKEHYREDITLESLADQFGYSPTYLSRMFRKYAQINYKSYLDSVRLEYASRELLQTKRKIGEIAIGNGFPNSKSFSKAFFTKYGIMPSDYRREHR